MYIKKFLIFSVIFCLMGALEGQTEDVTNTSEKSVIIQSDQVKEASDLKLNNKNETDIKSNEMENKTENIEKIAETTTPTPNDTPNVLKVMEIALNDEDQVMLQNLNGIIEKVPEMNSTATQQNREGKSFKDENLKRAAEALTDEEITEIIKSISFPHDDEITEDSEAHKLATETDVEPRSTDGTRNGKSLKTHSHGYYVIAFTPVEDETDNKLHDTLPYTRLQILPAERSRNGDAIDNPRFISKKSWNRYIRRIMRQIRKGTRKIQRKTKVKTLKEEPTVENFLKRMYKISQEKRLKQQQTKKKSSWFIW
ncbi:hypothetical protein FF38_12854 [Lucilia cuprina]|uniref:DUF4794 domain-containing protein n=1 Tax=Lucilia cuprina TaxID=7375 RepID=A0A0L0BV09_LUCCU|nr:hypothetical protein CVS40_2105 [Lucilia cuprina]KNC23838.1 hypothetical protein FF38_12854 [Lucilia cuprina]